MEEYEPLDEDEIEDMVEKRIKAEKKRRKKQGYYRESGEHKAISILAGAVCGLLICAINFIPMFYWMDMISNVTDNVLYNEVSYNTSEDVEVKGTKIYNGVKFIDKYLVQDYRKSFVIETYENLGIINLMNSSVQQGAIVITYNDGEKDVNIYANEVAKHYLSHTLRLTCALLDVNYKYDEGLDASDDVDAMLNHPLYLQSVEKVATFIATNDKVNAFLDEMLAKDTVNEDGSPNFMNSLMANILGVYKNGMDVKGENGEIVHWDAADVIANDLNTVSDVVVVMVKHNRLLASIIKNDMSGLLSDKALTSDLIGVLSGLSGYKPAMEGLFTAGVGLITPKLGLPENDAAGYDLFVSQLVSALKDAEAITEAQREEIQKLFVAAAEYKINEGKIDYVEGRIEDVEKQIADREAIITNNLDKINKIDKINNIDRISEIDGLLSDVESTLTDEEKEALNTERDELLANFTAEEQADLTAVKNELLTNFTEEEKTDLAAVRDDLAGDSATQQYLINDFKVELNGDGEMQEGENADGLYKLLEDLEKEREESTKSISILDYIVDPLRIVEIIRDEGLHLKDEANELKEQGTAFESQGEALKTDIEATKNNIEAVIAEIAQLEAEFQLGNKTQDEYEAELAQLTQKRNELNNEIDNLTQRSQKLIQDGKNLFAKGEVMAEKASDLADNATNCLKEAEARLEEFTPFIAYFMSWNSVQKPLLTAGEDITSACMSIRINGKLYVCNTDAITIDDIIDLVFNGMGDMSFGDIGNVGEGEEDEIPDLKIDDVLEELPFKGLFETITIVEIDETNNADYDGRVSPYTNFVNYLIATASDHKGTEGATEIDDAWFFDALSRYNTVLSESESYIEDNSVELINAILNARESKEYDYKGLTVEDMNAALNFGAWDDASIKVADTTQLASIIFELIDLLGNIGSDGSDVVEMSDSSESADGEGNNTSGLLGGGDLTAILDLLGKLGTLMDGMAETECLKNLPNVMIQALFKHEKISLIMTSTMLYNEEDGYLTKLEKIKAEYEKSIDERERAKDEHGNYLRDEDGNFIYVHTYEGFMTDFLANIQELIEKLDTNKDDGTTDDGTTDDGTTDDGITDDGTTDDGTTDDGTTDDGTTDDGTTDDGTTDDDTTGEGGNGDA